MELAFPDWKLGVTVDFAAFLPDMAFVATCGLRTVQSGSAMSYGVIA